MKSLKGLKFMKKKLKEKRLSGFTLAEVLITLSVIGIIAAITLPSLIVNVNERSFDAKKRALVARLSQAIPQLSTLSGYGTYTLGAKQRMKTATPQQRIRLIPLPKHLLLTD